jgi:hypothetical protein
VHAPVFVILQYPGLARKIARQENETNVKILPSGTKQPP